MGSYAHQDPQRKVPESFAIKNGVHGFDADGVDVLDGVGERDGRLQTTNAILVGEVDLEIEMLAS